MTKHDSGEVVTILPFINNRVLMQLRDFDPKINHPGCWGYFSGSIQRGEKPSQAAKRELFEEIGYTAPKMKKLGKLLITDLNNLVAHTFCCSLQVPLEQLTLTEGVEMTLATPEEIRSKKIYSKSLHQFFPVAPTSYLQKALNMALAAQR